MPTSDRPARVDRPGLTRRTVLFAGPMVTVAAITASCGLRLETDPPPPAAPLPPTADELARERAATEVAALLGQVDAVRRTRPDAAAPLAVVAAAHRAHLAALRPARSTPTDIPTSMQTGTPTDTPTDTPAGTPPDTPPDTPADTPTGKPSASPPTLAALVAAEQDAAAALLADLASVGSPTARLLASMAAAMRVHAIVLRRAAS